MNKTQRTARNTEIIRKRLAGIPVQVIATEYNLSREAVYLILDAAGIVVVPVLQSDNPRRDVEALGIQILTTEDLK